MYGVEGFILPKPGEVPSAPPPPPHPAPELTPHPAPPVPHYVTVTTGTWEAGTPDWTTTISTIATHLNVPEADVEKAIRDSYPTWDGVPEHMGAGWTFHVQVGKAG
jgi:hypothetical protein